MVAPTDGVRASSPVSEREREILRALGRAVITPGEHVPAPDEATVQGALDQLACMPSPARAAWRAGLATLSLAVRARTGRSMTRCPPDRLRALRKAKGDRLPP